MEKPDRSSEEYPVQINQYGPDAEKQIKESKKVRPGGKGDKGHPGGHDPRGSR